MAKYKVALNMDDITFGELELFEGATGLVLSDAIKQEIVRDKDGRPVPDPDDPKGRPLKEVKMSTAAMTGMIFIALRRDNPDLTMDDVRALKMSDVDLDLTEDAAENPSTEQPTDGLQSD